MIVNLKRAGLLFAMTAGALLAGCNPAPDYGNPCRLTRPSAGDGGIEFIQANDPAIDARFDFLANGDPECEDLVCIRQHGKDYGSLDEVDGVAHGECSTPCIDDTDCGDASRGLTCNQLAFDPDFLAQLQQNDPATYAEYFGDSAASSYCIDPNLPDLQ